MSEPVYSVGVGVVYQSGQITTKMEIFGGEGCHLNVLDGYGSVCVLSYVLIETCPPFANHFKGLVFLPWDNFEKEVSGCHM